MIERRKCKRFKIPGTRLSFKVRSLFLKRKYTEECFPTGDISKGGLMFSNYKPFKKNARISMKIFIPGEEDPWIMRGRVRWIMLSPGMSYRYKVGIEFDPYGKDKRSNNPIYLEKLRDLEEKYSL